MISCEYLCTNIDEEKRRTKNLRIRNLRFFKKGRRIVQSDWNLSLADTITLTFELQKSDERHESFTMHRSGDSTLCPVQAWAAIVHQILGYPGTNYSTTVNTIFLAGKLKTINSSTACKKIRSAAEKVGKDHLGFHPDDIGTHSIHSGAAMAMYLDGVPTFTIMLIGRWSSDAFLRYIWKQVEQFTHKVSSRMLQHDSFFTTPDYYPQVPCHNTRSCRYPCNFATGNFGGVAARREPFDICV